jgi:hypothetical protein
MDKFCQTCGQKTTTHKFSLRSIFDNGILYGIFMINKGFFFTLKELFIRPGHSIREYLEGKRVNHFNAFSFLLLLIAIAYFIEEYSGFQLSDMMDEDNAEFATSLEGFMEEYPRAVYILNIPIMAITSFLLFRKSNLNFAENIILNTYNSAAQILLVLPFTILAVFYKNIEVLSLLFTLTPIIGFGYYFWFYYQLFSKYEFKKRNLILRSILSIIIFSLLQGIAFASIVGIRKL